MISDSITSSPIHSAVISKDFGKKKKTNRSAKLKQCKLDVRREQWLAQVNGKGKDQSNGVSDKMCVLPLHSRGENHSLGDLERNPIGEDNGGSIHNFSDSESPLNSPISCNSSLLSSKNSGTNFSGSSSRSSTSGGSCSGNISEEDGDDGCLDDWEAVADALAVGDQQDRPSAEQPTVNEPAGRLIPPHQGLESSALGVNHQSKQDRTARVPSVPTGRRAWRSDDALRPSGLPNLSKQHSLPMNTSHHYGAGGISRGCNRSVTPPSSCPICFEDLDVTDSSFLPCVCGFRLCLFCHKRILEEDGRCPGCRKKYHHDIVKGEPSLNGGSPAFRLARACSMFVRS